MAFLSGYFRRKKITIDGDAHLSGSLTDQAVAIHIDSGETDFWANAPANGNQVRFTSSDGTTLLKFEVESFDATGDDAWYHVKVPTLSGSVDTDIYIYYDPDTPTDGSDKENVWDSNYKGVWHLNEDHPVSEMDDATSNNTDGTDNGTINGAGQVDKGRDFDGINDYIGFGSPASLDISGEMTIEGWFSFDDLVANTIPFGQGSGAGVIGQYRIIAGVVDNEIQVGWGNVGVDNSTLSLSTGVLYHLGFTRSGSSGDWTCEIYGNGALDETVSSVVTNPGSQLNFSLGRQGDFNGAYHGGIIDEVTISDVARSADWWAARYQSGLGTWLTIAAEEDANVNVLATTDVLAITEYAADISLGVFVAATTDALAITEHAADVNLDKSVAASTDTLAITEHAADVNLDKSVAAATDALAITEHSADVVLGINIVASTDALAITEHAAVIDIAYNIVAAVDALILTPYAATVSTTAIIKNKYIPKAVLADSSLEKPQKVTIQ